MKFISGNSRPTTSAASFSSTCTPLCPFTFSRSSSRFKLTSSSPPRSAKLFLAFAGWIIGYDGHFDFNAIGDSYIENKVPYISLRAFPAAVGSLVPGVVYAIMRESGYPRLVGILSASLVLIGECDDSQNERAVIDPL